MKKQKVTSSLRLKKLTISDLQSGIIKGGVPTTQQSTVLPAPFTTISNSSTKDPRPGTISHSNCGQCTSWNPGC